MDTQANVISVKEAAVVLGCNQETIRLGMRNGSFPIGCAIRAGRTKTRYNYIIPRKAFENFMNGTRPQEAVDD